MNTFRISKSLPSLLCLLMGLLAPSLVRADAIENSIDAAIMRQHHADVASGKVTVFRAPAVSTQAAGARATAAAAVDANVTMQAPSVSVSLSAPVSAPVVAVAASKPAPSKPAATIAAARPAAAPAKPAAKR